MGKKNDSKGVGKIVILIESCQKKNGAPTAGPKRPRKQEKGRAKNRAIVRTNGQWSMWPSKKAVRGGRNKVDNLPSDPGCHLRKSSQGRGEKRGLECGCKGGPKNAIKASCLEGVTTSCDKKNLREGAVSPAVGRAKEGKQKLT